MWKFLIICIVISTCYSEGGASTARKVSRRRRGYAGGYAGGYASGYAGGYGGGAGGYAGSGGGAGGYASSSGGGGVGGGGGYAGGHNDYDDYGGGFVPHFGITDPYLFHQQLTNQILAQNFATQQATTKVATSGDALVSAGATISDDDTRIQQQIAAQQAYHDNVVRQNSYRGGSGGSGGSGSSGGAHNSHRYAPSFAHASGSIGPSGHKQTAYINPPNPDSPNIVNRFGDDSSSGFSHSSGGGGGGGGAGGGYKGVSVSSFSSSNGDGTSRRGAQTTINDNGKVTSYSVHS